MRPKQTSLLAYWSLKEDDLGQRQKTVFDVIAKYGPMSNLDVAEYLGLPINSITPRTLELRQKGVVKEAYKGLSKQTKRKTIFWETIL